MKVRVIDVIDWLNMNGYSGSAEDFQRDIHETDPSIRQVRDWFYENWLEKVLKDCIDYCRS